MDKDNEIPSNLGGLGGMLPAEVLEMLNELLEQLHQRDHSNQGGNVINIFMKGSQKVDHVENQYFYGNEFSKIPPKKNAAPPLPTALFTEQAMTLWRKVQKERWIDENYQPLISRPLAALLADAMAERLKIKEKWKVFEALWQRKHMRNDYNEALSQQQFLEFLNKLKKVIR